MQQYFKKYFWTFRAGAIVALALLLAGAVSALIARSLTPYALAVPEAARGPAQKSDARKPRPQLANVLQEVPEAAPVDKCADVECRPSEACNPETGACEPVEEAAEDGKGPCHESDIALSLVGTMYSPNDTQWSIAVLRNPSTSKTEFARVGSNLLNEASVDSIERNRVWITRQGRRECLRPSDGTPKQAARPGIGGRAGAGRPQEPTPPAPISAGPGSVATVTGGGAAGGSLEDRIRNGVSSTGPNAFNVDRSVLREVASNSKLLQEQAPRVAPYYEGGKPRGFRLQGLKAGGIFSAIGIRNGDVIVSVNGAPVDSPQRALDLYQNLMTQSSLNLTVLRRGKEETLNYAVK